MDTVCLGCKGRRVVCGSVHGMLPMNSLIPWIMFRPDGLRWFSVVGRDISFDDRFRACLDCGLTWSRVPAKGLTRIVMERGKTELKRQLGI